MIESLATAAMAGFAAKNISQVIVGNAADQAFRRTLTEVSRTISHTLRKGERPVNHDLQRAVRKAYLQSTWYLCERCALEQERHLSSTARMMRSFTDEIKGLKDLAAQFRKELEQVETDGYPLPINKADQHPELLLALGDSQEPLKKLRTKLYETLLEELRSRHNEARFGPFSSHLEKMIKDGWQERGADDQQVTLRWFDLLCGFFAHELKSNEAVRSIFTSKALAQLLQDSKGHSRTLSIIESKLAEQGRVVSERLTGLDRQLTELVTSQRTQFKEVLGVLKRWLPQMATNPAHIENTLWEIQQELRKEMAAQRQASDSQTALLHELTTLLHKCLLPMFTRGLPTHYKTRIQNFIYEYLGTAKRAMPFGGRQAELEKLDEWLNDASAAPYMLLVAEAGRGKSALLVRWTQSVLARNLANVVFVPISIRFRTALASVTFTILAAQLGEIYAEGVNWSNQSAEQFRGMCADYLDRTPQTDKPLVIVLDGLDEAADWKAGPDLFPFQPPERVRIIVSARYQVGDVNEEGWRQQLGWIHARHHLADTLSLEPLTTDGVRDVLQQMGNPLDKLANKVNAMRELYRLTEGDPLLIRLYVDALLPQDLAMLQPDELKNTAIGLKGYFQQWWKDQKQLWDKDRPLRQKNVLIVLNLLACALGPLRKDILLELAPTNAELESWLLGEALAPFSRLVVGDGDQQGYTFSHSRLSNYFWEQMAPKDQKEWEQRFLDYGRQTLNALNHDILHPRNASSYAIQYYGAHLERANLIPLPQTFYTLVNKGWMQAWEALTGTHAGFLNDVERAWLRAENERNIAMQIKRYCFGYTI